LSQDGKIRNKLALSLFFSKGKCNNFHDSSVKHHTLKSWGGMHIAALRPEEFPLITTGYEAGLGRTPFVDTDGKK
jgi:hypothetical protein